METKPISQNAKVAAISFPCGAILLHGLNQVDTSLLPLRLFAIALLVFGVWAFSDEMGLKKPLNRASFVSFIFAMTALIAIVLEPKSARNTYYLIYAFGLLIALLGWCAAFLHRQETLRWVGALGASISVLPLLLLLAGHLSLGGGALFGFSALFNLPTGAKLLGSPQLNSIEAMLVVWSIVAASCLLRGSIAR